MTEFLDIVEFRRATSAEDLESIQRLRYRSYRREDFIDANDSGLCTDSIEYTPNAMSFGLYVAGQLVAAIRLHVLTKDCPYGPSMLVFPDIIQPELDEGRVFIDPSRFVTDEESARLYPELPYMTLRIVVMASLYFNADYGLSSIRKEHAAFYRRVFNSTVASDVRSYTYVRMQVQLMKTDVDSLRSTFFQRYPFFASNYVEQRQLFGPRDALISTIAA
ncbi:MAG: hypothetical protein AAF468_13500 [Pseudomonadota bacterium]